MARYQIILAYDGTGFAGSQRQAGARTVQGDLENALRRIGWRGESILLAGRTDAGVHASGQVAAFDLEWRHSDEELLKALNSQLPAEMAVQALHTVGDTFHPRFDATSRRYRYRLFCSQVRDPLRERYAWRVWPMVDAGTLHDASRLLLGTHDFADFGTPPRAGSSTVRTVTMAEWQMQGDEWFFTVQAEAFLYRMVRKMVFVQVAVAQKRFSVETLAEALAGGRREGRLPGGLAPAAGLTLVNVTYS